MDSTLAIYLTSAALFVFTLFFSYGYNMLSSMMKAYSYVKCMTGGFIISIILFEILPDIYSSKTTFPVLMTGISFLLLFAISKLYIEKVDAEDQDSIPEGATKKEALVFILALSLHSFMEGLGMSTKSDEKLCWYICGLFLHKWLEAVVLGTSVLTSGFRKKTCFYLLLVYSSLTSIGALLGKLIGRAFESSRVAQALDGIAAGSFFYIGFVEMVGNEFERRHKQARKEKTEKKVASMVGGFSVMTGLIYIADHLENV